MIKNSDCIEKLKSKLGKIDVENEIPLMNAGHFFIARMTPEGVWVSNLDTSPMLKWSVFDCAISLGRKIGVGERIRKGNAMQGRLGDDLLPLDSIEGIVAHNVFDQPLGSSVFRKISAIGGVLSWAEIFTNGRGYMTFNGCKK
jgi:hypothetical protein